MSKWDHESEDQSVCACNCLMWYRWRWLHTTITPKEEGLFTCSNVEGESWYLCAHFVWWYSSSLLIKINVAQLIFLIMLLSCLLTQVRSICMLCVAEQQNLVSAAKLPKKTTLNLLVRVHWLCDPVSAGAAVDAAVVEDSPAWSNLQFTHINILTLVAVLQCENSSRVVLSKPLNP